MAQSNFSYIGNPDYRGYLSALAHGGNTLAGDALSYVGNDGKLNNSYKTTYHFDTDGPNASDLNNFNNSSYNTFQQLLNAGNNTTTTPAAAPDLSGYDQSINQYKTQLGQLDPSLNNALSAANGTYQTTLNGLNQNKAQTDQTFNQNKLTNQQDFVGNKNTIRTNTGNTIDSLSRLGGSRGASGQSALAYAQQLAAGQGSQQLAGAGTTFAKNQQGLDQNYGNYVNTYNQNVTAAGQQKDADENNARATNASSRASLLQSLAGIVNQRTAAAGGTGTAASQGYLDQANALNAEATRLSAPRTVAAQQPLTYTAPTLDSYTANPLAVAGAGSDAALQSVTPFLAALRDIDRVMA